MSNSNESKIQTALKNAGIPTNFYVLDHFPRKYEEFSLTENEALYAVGDRLVIQGYINDLREISKSSRLSIIRIEFISLNGFKFGFMAYNQPYLLKKPIGSVYLYTISGRVKSRAEIVFETLQDGGYDVSKTFRPIYTLPKEVKNYQFSQLISNCLKQYEGKIYDTIPSDFLCKRNLLTREEMYQKIHFPLSKEEIRKAIYTLKYEEALLFSLRSQIVKENSRRPREASLLRGSKEIDIIKNLFVNIPFSLTESQKKAVRDIYNDMNSPFLMNRLIQGEVGSGKTLVAAMALFFNAISERQGVIMVPSETLANQHFVTLTKLFASESITTIGLLRSSLSAKEKKEMLDKLENGQINIIVGTHALFSKNVRYKNLGLVIIDEQHKFGTLQRKELFNKGANADVLMMSATPIPRTLSLSLFGELDVSEIEENPTGVARNVETKILSANSPNIYVAIQKALEDKRNIFIVAPQIDGGKQNISIEYLFQRFADLYPNLVTIMHGKKKASEQKEVMDDFISCRKPILLATSIVEVGIDVTNATLMIVYGADHFGLASLHQLRGRIGRDGSPSKFILISDENATGLGQKRLSVISETDDGLEIAAYDLKMRGPGEIEGIKQTGNSEFKYINPVRDNKLLRLAKADATYILDHAFEQKYQYIIRKANQERDDNIKA